MELKLNEDEIRKALAKALAAKVSYTLGEFDPDECWFEVKAGSIDGEEVNDLYDVSFCCKVAT